MKRSTILFLIAFMFSCASRNEEVIEVFSIESIHTFAEPNVKFGEPYLFTSPKGKVYLSWIEVEEEINYLKYSQLFDGEWSPPIQIASGSDWFVNWADYPQLAAFEDGTLIAFFLVKNGKGTFSYDIKTTVSQNGLDWSDPMVIHDDGTQTEHGFGSMFPWGNDMLITWLDGRNTQEGSHDHANHNGHAGQMNLRAAILTNEGVKLDEWLLDDRVCDCCQTAIILFENSPMVFFRDRSHQEVRDIGMIRFVDNTWQETQPVYNDFWKVEGCPVNGPRAASFGNTSAVVWYTGVNGKSEVKVSFIQSGESTFDKPIKIDLGKTIGRVDIALLDEETAVVSWMEGSNIYLREVNVNGVTAKPILIASSSEKRSSGFPQLTIDDETIVLAWSDDSGDDPVIKTAKIKVR
ncbi:exo-alpha-sialidase [Belliella sp. R4-6]|uniref:Exo-alpha-sialidase n=1 Tax=Belliella alkalica TaxID=1730871 RepID=A0ABS9VAR3_9BACT|nr:exo-alpha-sialidase [Belliella alkalica]MCH7413160.1 exo-alpha-sialidase [Belliella alkalica]